MISDNDQRAVFGDLFEVVRGGRAENIQVFQNLLHHINSFQVAVFCCELLELLSVKQPF
ncbi:hypothetical protein D3C87_2033580 [compost metagenome]